MYAIYLCFYILFFYVLCAKQLPMVQLLAVKPAAQIHHPSVGRHVSGWQFGEHTWEQFVPKYPFKQARNTNTQKES